MSDVTDFIEDTIVHSPGMKVATGVFKSLTGANETEAERARLAAAAEEEAATALESRRSSLLQQKTGLKKSTKKASAAGGSVSSGANIKSEYTGTLLG